MEYPRSLTFHKSSIRSVKRYVGESIEEKARRITTENSPIPTEIMIGEHSFQPRSEGVGFNYNPRSDRFEEAVDNMDKASRDMIAKRDALPDDFQPDEAHPEGTPEGEGQGEPES